ncbi:uncharacterized protein FFB14_04741 [Fusarium fujikuroi]|nr:uncharacterized protein FFB14_04741 [Fusarium fujikuroi]
MALLSIKLL